MKKRNKSQILENMLVSVALRIIYG